MAVARQSTENSERTISMFIFQINTRIVGHLYGLVISFLVEFLNTLFRCLFRRLSSILYKVRKRLSASLSEYKNAKRLSSNSYWNLIITLQRTFQG